MDDAKFGDKLHIAVNLPYSDYVFGIDGPTPGFDIS